jgi:hypothetical protein
VLERGKNGGCKPTQKLYVFLEEAINQTKWKILISIFGWYYYFMETLILSEYSHSNSILYKAFPSTIVTDDTKG